MIQRSLYRETVNDPSGYALVDLFLVLCMLLVGRLVYVSLEDLASSHGGPDDWPESMEPTEVVDAESAVDEGALGIGTGDDGRDAPPAEGPGASASQRFPQDTGMVHRELLGLHGDLERVVFVVDISESMEDDWLRISGVISTWVKYLEISECAVVAFNDDILVFPESGGMISTNMEKAALLDWLSRIRPSGRTNTFEALKTAFQYESVDTVILFTDGQPSDPRSRPSDPETGQYTIQVRRDIRQLCREEGIPVNVVGLGNYYYAKELTEFLIGITEDSGGAFIGR